MHHRAAQVPLFLDIAEFAEEHGGTYHVAPDVGSSPQDMLLFGLPSRCVVRSSASSQTWCVDSAHAAGPGLAGLERWCGRLGACDPQVNVPPTGGCRGCRWRR